MSWKSVSKRALGKHLSGMCQGFAEMDVVQAGLLTGVTLEPLTLPYCGATTSYRITMTERLPTRDNDFYEIEFPTGVSCAAMRSLCFCRALHLRSQ